MARVRNGPDVDPATIVALLGALGVGGLLTEFVAGGRTRRQTRAEMLEALIQVEETRWAPARSPSSPTRLGAFRRRR
jgi:hypothetical protein